jgi:uncharacterized membrane protein
MQASNHAGMDKARLTTLVDGVFAIVMTLLVFKIDIPDNTSLETLGKQLHALVPKLLMQVVACAILGVLWVGHYAQFHFIRRVDRPYIWLNLLFLLSIVHLPFASTLLTEFPREPLAIGVFGGLLITAGLTNLCYWLYATHRGRLVDEAFPKELLRRAVIRILVAPMLALLAVLFSFFMPEASLVFFGLILVFYLLPISVDFFFR